MDLSGYGVVSPRTHHKLISFLSNVYSRRLDLKSLITEFLEFAVEVAEAEAGFALLYGGSDETNSSAEKNLIVSTFGWQLTNHSSLPAELMEIVQSTLPKRSYVTPLEQEPEKPRLFDSAKARLTVPVLNDNRVVGAVILESSERYHFTEECRTTLEESATEVACLRKRIIFSEWAKSRGYDLYLIGRSAAIKRVEELVEKISVADCPVLILGESGTGKEIIALLLHYYSRRRNKPNVVVNCGAFTSDTLLASELFGHVRGAFTDARTEKRGTFETAHTGTIFLDEVSCMSQRMQVALLRTLRYGEVQKIGDDELRRKVDVRIVSASNQDLKDLIKNGSFREDVYYRLRVAEIRIPPLRERNGDTQLLTEYFLEQYSRLDGLPLKSVTTEAMAALLSHQWPDNVAGLENAIRSALLVSNNQIGLQDLPEHLRAIEHEPKAIGGNGHAEVSAPLTPTPPESLMPLFEELETHEKKYIQQALRINGWNVSRTAKVLGITRQGLQKKIRTYGLKNTRV